jgi:hypothetical protein
MTTLKLSTTKQLTTRLAEELGCSAARVQEAIRFRIRCGLLAPPAMVARTYLWTEADAARALKALKVDYHPRETPA